VMPALIRRFHEAKMRMERRETGDERGKDISHDDEVAVWGTGTPMREFLYVDDMADGCVYVLNLDDETLAEHLLSYPKPCFVNLGTGIDVTIRELAETIREVVGYTGRLSFDATKPDGTPRKLQDVSRMKALGWEAKVTLREGIERTYRWFLDNQGRFRA